MGLELLFPCVLYLLCVGLPVFFNAMHQHREPSPNAIRGALRAHGKGPVYKDHPERHPRDREPHSTLKSSTHAYFPAGLEVFKIF